MALTVTTTGDWNGVTGNRRFGLIQIAFDSSYPTGGETLNAVDFGLRVIEEIEFLSNGRFGYMFYTDTTLPATSVSVEVLCPTGGDSAPTSDAAPTLAITGVMTAAGGDSSSLVGHTHPVGQNTGGRGVEMGNTADLSSLTAIWVRAVGY